jgi:oligoribonuclease (3'-5' exoribonuclease)
MMFLWTDCETTGLINSKHEILTCYMGVYNEKLELVDELDLMLKPEHGDINRIIYDPEAALVTGINLAEHLSDPSTITYEQGKEKILALFERNKIPRKRKHFRLSGHNVDFDKNFILAKLMDSEDWEKYVHYSSLDTLRITVFLQDIGFLPADLGNLGSLVGYFDIPLGKAHNAREDIKMNVEVYKAIRAMMKTSKDGLSGISDHNLLSIVELD